jgi:predicted nucleic acid-binding protein
MFLLDTNVVSELRRPDRADPRVLAWANDKAPADLFISAITVLEIELGVQQAALRRAPQAEIYRRWLDQQVVPFFRDRILPVDEAVARACGRMQAVKRRPDRDGLIAATAVAHRLTVVSRNVRDFPDVTVLDPWAAH